MKDLTVYYYTVESDNKGWLYHHSYVMMKQYFHKVISFGSLKLNVSVLGHFYELSSDREKRSESIFIFIISRLVRFLATSLRISLVSFCSSLDLLRVSPADL